MALQKTCHIIYLNLDMNSICWEGASYLAKALGVNNSLIELSMCSGKSGGKNRNRIMERGAYEISKGLAVNKFLMFLNLTGNAIANEGLSYLLPAIAMSNTLTSLNLTSNEINSGPIRQ
jgi:Ran GTPase-activating protein (RanGAP) involved in mRNA processing and transport